MKQLLLLILTSAIIYTEETSFIKLANQENSTGEEHEIVMKNLDIIKKAFGGKINKTFEELHVAANIKTIPYQDVFSLSRIVDEINKHESYGMYIPLGLLIISANYSEEYYLVDNDNGMVYKFDIDATRTNLKWNPGLPIPDKNIVIKEAIAKWPSIEEYFQSRINEINSKK